MCDRFGRRRLDERELGCDGDWFEVYIEAGSNEKSFYNSYDVMLIGLLVEAGWIRNYYGGCFFVFAWLVWSVDFLFLMRSGHRGTERTNYQQYSIDAIFYESFFCLI